MAVLKTTLFCLVILWKSCVDASNPSEDWKTATATYTKETDGSIIDGTFLSLSLSLSLSFLFLSSLVLLIMVLESLFNLKKKKKLMLQKELVGMVTFTESPMGSTVQGLAAYCSTEAVPVGLAMS